MDDPQIISVRAFESTDEIIVVLDYLDYLLTWRSTVSVSKAAGEEGTLIDAEFAPMLIRTNDGIRLRAIGKMSRSSLHSARPIVVTVTNGFGKMATQEVWLSRW